MSIQKRTGKPQPPNGTSNLPGDTISVTPYMPDGPEASSPEATDGRFVGEGASVKFVGGHSPKK